MKLTNIINEIKIIPNKLPFSAVKEMVIRYLKENINNENYKKLFSQYNMEEVYQLLKETKNFTEIIDLLPGRNGFLNQFEILCKAIIDETR